MYEEEGGVQLTCRETRETEEREGD